MLFGFTILSSLGDMHLRLCFCFGFDTGIPGCLFGEETAGKEAEQALSSSTAYLFHIQVMVS